MKYFVMIGSREIEIEVDDSSVTVEGRRYPAELRAIAGTPLRQLILDSRPRVFVATGSGGGRWTLLDQGELNPIEVMDQRARHIRSVVGAGRAHRRGGVVKAPMPGLVVRLLVGPGSTVAQGDGLVVLEAMKMENELKATGPGRVERVEVSAGQAVEKGAVLVVLVPDDQ